MEMNEDHADRRSPSSTQNAKPSTDDVISNTIKQAFIKVESEPLPDELQSLLEQLKAAGRG